MNSELVQPVQKN